MTGNADLKKKSESFLLSQLPWNGNYFSALILQN